MSERRLQAGPSNPNSSRRQPNATSSSPFGSMMKLFAGGRTAKQPSTSPSGLGWGRLGAASSARNASERESLIPSSSGSGGDDFDDSDAISLLSNIADRDSRRGGSSAAARRRARTRAKAQGRTCGMFWFDLEDGLKTMSCGLLGRNGEDDGNARGGRQRAASIGSVMSRGARSSHTAGGTSGIVGVGRHSRSLSDASTDSGGSLVGPGFAESGDEDAGMLDDQAIARFGQPQTSSTANTESAKAQAKVDAEAAEAAVKAKRGEEEEEAARAKAEAEAAERAKARELEAARLQAEAEAEAARQAEEEARLAAAEEAAIAKARHKAERKAAKAGLLKLQQETQSAQRWRTEAEAEAAAGGFTFADAAEDGQEYDPQAEGRPYAQQHFNYHDDNVEYEAEVDQGEFGQYGDAEEVEGYYETHEERGFGDIVHHHHYYHAPPQPEAEEQFTYVPSSHLSNTGGAFSESQNAASQPTAEAETADKTVSEDEADIAGLSFGRKKNRRHDSGSASGSRSGSGLHPYNLPSHTGGSSSGGSANGLRAHLSASSSSGKAHYRDRPRRHERTSSKSSNSSSGIFSYQSSNAIHPHPPPSTVATSIASPAALPNLYESEPIYKRDSVCNDGNEQGEGEDAVGGSQFGKPNVVSDEFGVITAGTNKGGAGRVKKSYRNKRSKSQVGGGAEAEVAFEGFPGF